MKLYCILRPNHRTTTKTAAFLRTACLVAAATIIAASASHAQDTEDYFRANCTSCHTIGGGRLVGPDLKGVLERKDREWLANFISDPMAVINSGDTYAAQLRDAAGGALMPTLSDMNHDRAEKLLDLIEQESLAEESAFAGLSIDDEPFTSAEIEHGRLLFRGDQRLSAGGPACLSCHTVRGVGGLGGGQLGPDLTRVYERLMGRKSLAAWLQAPATATMRPIYRTHSLSNDEIVALVAFLEESAQAGGEAPKTFQTILLVLGLFGAALSLFAADSIWKGRFRGVRIPMVKG